MELTHEILGRFNDGFTRAKAAGVVEPTAMTLATGDGQTISCRTVLLKALDSRGFVFYTNLGSRKALQIAAYPRAALTFLWRDIQEQVLVEGMVEPVDDSEADDYFGSRSRGSQIGAWASKQSQTMERPGDLMRNVEKYEQRFADQPVPRPPHWSGYRVMPDMVEFWYGQNYRLHDRYRYQWQDAAWHLLRLYP